MEETHIFHLASHNITNFLLFIDLFITICGLINYLSMVHFVSLSS